MLQVLCSSEKKAYLLNCSFPFHQPVAWGYGDTEIMSAKCLEIFGSKSEENWEILLDDVYFSRIYDFFYFIFNASASEDLTVLSVVPHTFLREDLQFIKKKKEREYHRNCNITAAAPALTQTIMHTSLRAWSSLEPWLIINNCQLLWLPDILN